jgi:hypothetical protein
MNLYKTNVFYQKTLVQHKVIRAYKKIQTIMYLKQTIKQHIRNYVKQKMLKSFLIFQMKGTSELKESSSELKESSSELKESSSELKEITEIQLIKESDELKEVPEFKLDNRDLYLMLNELIDDDIMSLIKTNGLQYTQISENEELLTMITEKIVDKLMI